jgi:hypothetical protein
MGAGRKRGLSAKCGYLAGFALATLLGGPARALAAPSAELETQDHGSASRDEQDIRRVITEYAQAIETRDVPLFKKVKPNLSKDEEDRLRRAFATIQSQVVKITVLAIEIKGGQATARLARRDTINGSIVSSFPQTLSLGKAAGGWTIDQIGR